MSVHNKVPLAGASFYYPIGNTPPVCLTQDLPPEQDADILLLGCGDARNVLFTCFADNARKIDVTCCDIEPMMHARNVLLYSLLIDDISNLNIEQIWNIYYHWKIDGNSVKLLESQSRKLLDASRSIDDWHGSVFGSNIRFCDEKSLSAVRNYWSGFMSYHLSRLEDVIETAKKYRLEQKKGPDMAGYRSGFPVTLYKTEDDLEECLCKACKIWWDSGILPSSNSPTPDVMHLNPAFLYSPNYKLTMHYGLSPLGAIPLSTAYAAITKGSVFYIEDKSTPVEHLVDCAKSHFVQWASAFRKAIENGSVIRIFVGDALNFCFTLHNCQLTGSTSMNLPCHNQTSSPLILYHSDYGHKKNAAPLSFNIIDTSNLSDYLGPLNLLVLAPRLLKQHATSCLYTELLLLYDFSLLHRLRNLFGVDVRSMALLLGLVPPELFTKVSNAVEDCVDHYNVPNEAQEFSLQLSGRSRLRWKQSSGNLQMDAEELAKFLIKVYDAMFNPGDLTTSQTELAKLNMCPYNQASFALLLSILKVNIISDWDKCLKEIYDKILSNPVFQVNRGSSVKDLGLCLHVFGVDSSLFTKPNPTDMQNPTLTSILPKCNKDLPDQLCVTIQISKEHLFVFQNFLNTPLFIICRFEARYPDGKRQIESFSSVQIMFGKLHTRNEKGDSYPCFEEDSARISGSSDMFVSVMVPTSMLTYMLLNSNHLVPTVKCGLNYSLSNMRSFGLSLGSDLCFYSSKITSKNISITEFMPGTSGLPKYNIASDRLDKRTLDTTVLRLSPDGSQVNSLVKRVAMETEAAKATLAMKSSPVEVTFKSPLTAVVSIAKSYHFNLEFPVPVSDSIRKYKLRIARTSLYVEIESCFFDPIEEESSKQASLFLFPCFLAKVSNSVVPVPWTAMRVNLDVMPSLDVEIINPEEITWLRAYAAQMCSVREYHLLLGQKEYDFRVSLKKGFVFLFSNYDSRRMKCFGLQKGKYFHILYMISCLRLDLVNNSVALDCALVPLTVSTVKDPLVIQFLQDLHKDGVFHIDVGETEINAWRAMMPAAAERCRTWKHTSECEYVKADEVPLSAGLDDDGCSPICSCGIGRFPVDYLKDHIRRYSNLSYVLQRYATRVAISPIFAIPCIEDCDTVGLRHECCGKCGAEERKNPTGDQQDLMTCSKCRRIKYCSSECQRTHWKEIHKTYCK